MKIEAPQMALNKFLEKYEKVGNPDIIDQLTEIKSYQELIVINLSLR